MLRASPRNPIEITSLTQVSEGAYEAVARVNKRGSEEQREKMSKSAPSGIAFKNTRSKPFWIALDEVQDPQVSIL